jgi:hypothetical protein
MSYVYFGTLYHKQRSEKLVLLDSDGYIVPIDKKIGKTKDVSRRELDLNRNSTKDPIGYVMIKAWRTGDDTDKIERSLHKILDHNRTEGEFFSDDDETLESRLSDFMNSLGYIEHVFGDNSVVTSSAKNIINDENIRSRVGELVGQRFFAKRNDIQATAEITADGKFKCVETGELYSSPSGLFGKTWKAMGASGLCTINGWDAKNEHGQSITAVLKSLQTKELQ